MSETARLQEILKDYASICEASSAEIKSLRERVECLTLSEEEMASLEDAARLLAPSRLSITLRLLLKRTVECQHG